MFRVERRKERFGTLEVGHEAGLRRRSQCRGVSWRELRAMQGPRLVREHIQRATASPQRAVRVEQVAVGTSLLPHGRSTQPAFLCWKGRTLGVAPRRRGQRLLGQELVHTAMAPHVPAPHTTTHPIHRLLSLPVRSHWRPCSTRRFHGPHTAVPPRSHADFAVPRGPSRLLSPPAQPAPGREQQRRAGQPAAS